MSNYHEPVKELDNSARDMTRALLSLKEEIDAIDWYNQRLHTTSDKQLKQILKHNMNDEMEHASMALEWLRRNMEGWDEKLKQFLFTTKNIVNIEKEE